MPDCTRGTETQEAPSEYQESFFHCDGDQALAQEPVEFSSLKIFKSSLNMVLDHLLALGGPA